MIKMRFTDNQTAFEYAAYVIASSYFKKAQCASKLTEQKMRLQFYEQKTNAQYSMESTCIRYMDRICEKLPKKFLEQEMTVRLRKNDVGHFDIVFTDGKYEACFKAVYAGRNSRLTCRIRQVGA